MMAHGRRLTVMGEFDEGDVIFWAAAAKDEAG